MKLICPKVGQYKKCKSCAHNKPHERFMCGECQGHCAPSSTELGVGQTAQSAFKDTILICVPVKKGGK